MDPNASDGPETRSGDAHADPIEAALATALEAATRAGEWSTVAELARELGARREAASAKVIPLSARRR